MKKKLIWFGGLFLLVVMSIVLHLYFTRDVVDIDYEYIKFSDNLTLDVYEDYEIRDFVVIENGSILNNRKINTKVIGKKEIEVLYEYKGNKKKAYVTLSVVDKVAPIILGSGSITLTVGSDRELEHIFLSADNYDKTPKREIIGEYDLSKVGEYNLRLEVTDNSSNTSIKDFVLRVVNKTTSNTTTNNSRTLFSDVVDKHKSDNTKIGLDISKWQGNVDFKKLESSGVEFVILRVGYQKGFGNSYEIDPYFYENMEKLKNTNIDVGVYFYTYAINNDEAIGQARWIIDKIKGYNINLPIVFDFESWSDFSKLNISIYDINDIARSFMDEITRNGYSAMNYSSKYYLENIWNINNYPVWLAHYTKETNYEGEYVMWQMCDNGKIDGINGNVDINVMYIK